MYILTRATGEAARLIAVVKWADLSLVSGRLSTAESETRSLAGVATRSRLRNLLLLKNKFAKFRISPKL